MILCSKNLKWKFVMQVPRTDWALMPNQRLLGHCRNGLWKDIEPPLFLSNSQPIMLWKVMDFLTCGYKISKIFSINKYSEKKSFFLFLNWILPGTYYMKFQYQFSKHKKMHQVHLSFAIKSSWFCIPTLETPKPTCPYSAKCMPKGELKTMKNLQTYITSLKWEKSQTSFWLMISNIELDKNDLT